MLIQHSELGKGKGIGTSIDLRNAGAGADLKN